MELDLPYGFREEVQETFDNIIDSWGKTCKLYYQPLIETCTACENANIIGNKPQFAGLSGGLVPSHSLGICHLCGGSGQRQSEQTEDVIMFCEWDVAKSWNPHPNITIPYGLLITRGYISDTPKIIQAIKMVAELPVAPVIRATYKLHSMPGDTHNIIQNRYFIAFWERIS